MEGGEGRREREREREGKGGRGREGGRKEEGGLTNFTGKDVFIVDLFFYPFHQLGDVLHLENRGGVWPMIHVCRDVLCT